KGYNSKLESPVILDITRHKAEEVGDEALLLAKTALCCASPDWVAGAKLLREQEVQFIIMDDGFQNPYLHKDISLLVVDSGYGFGNGRVIPAGPLREEIEPGLARADAVILLGNGSVAALENTALPLLRAQLLISFAPELKGKKLLAFCGIGRPAKFFDSLKQA